MYITWSRYLGKSSVISSAVAHATSDGLITAQFPLVKQSNKEAFLVNVHYCAIMYSQIFTAWCFCIHDQPEINNVIQFKMEHYQRRPLVPEKFYLYFALHAICTGYPSLTCNMHRISNRIQVTQ